MRGRYRVLTLAWCALALTAALSLPAARAQTEGTDYKVLTPSQPTPTDKIEVLPSRKLVFPLIKSSPRDDDPGLLVPLMQRLS